MITLRRAAVGDEKQIVRVRALVWQETYQGIYPEEMLYHDDLGAALARFAARLADPEHQIYLYCDEGECIGYFAFGPGNFGPYKDFTLCLNNLYIRKEYKGQGLGRRASACIWEYCKARQITKLYCGCNLHNTAAVGFYRHMGGIQADNAVLHESPADDIIHFEFYTGENI